MSLRYLSEHTESALLALDLAHKEAAYSAATPDDAKEDAILEKYVNV